MMKYFDWDEEKNQWLTTQRGISFEIIKELIEAGLVIAIVDNHEPYQHQKVYMLRVEDYIYEVPVVESDEKIFLVTAYPSRKATKLYLSEIE